MLIDKPPYFRLEYLCYLDALAAVEPAINGDTAMANPLFLVWYDDNPKIPVAQKITAATEAYAARFGLRPNLALIPVAESAEVQNVEVRPLITINRHTYWVGFARPEAV